MQPPKELCLKVLFSSDIHGMKSAFERFSELLRTDGYDAGILGGDLLDEYMTEEKVQALLGVPEDELIDELPGPDDDMVAVWKNSGSYLRQERAREVRTRLFEDILDAAHVPVFLVRGNHDMTAWPDTGYITDIHMKRVTLGGRAFAGYRWTEMERTAEDASTDMAGLSWLVDRGTVLVTHSPPKRILDGSRRWGAHYGLEALRSVRPKPWLHLFGHVHGLAGRKGRYVNGCWLTIRRFFEIDVDRRRVRLVE
ncbi:MAG TPA: metallophosphoesterase [bacterium]|nr:metallophosphoesterase [bacterium]